MKSVILKQVCGGFFKKNWEPLINLSWLKNEQVKVCFFTLESPYPYFWSNLRHMGMPYIFSEMQNKLSKTRYSPLESMGQIISSRCPQGNENSFIRCLSRDQDGCYAHIFKNILKMFFPRTSGPISTKLGMKHRRFKPVIFCSNNNPELTLSYFTTRSNFAT